MVDKGKRRSTLSVMNFSKKYTVQVSFRHGLKVSQSVLILAVKNLLEVDVAAVKWMMDQAEYGYFVLAMPDCETFRTIVVDEFELLGIKAALDPLTEVTAVDASENIYSFGNFGYSLEPRIPACG